MNKELRVSEVFYSIQGEGPTMGVPAVFLRLSSCNLMCGGRGTEKDGKLHDGATWRCDTIEVWLKGESHNPQEYALQFADDYGQEFRNGAHLIITGGEPMLQQKQLIPFIHILQSGFTNPIYIEIETNGTVEIDSNFMPLVDQFNVSPKLANSGMLERIRIKDTPMTQLSALSEMDQAFFKFVVTSEEDIKEVLQDYANVFGLPRQNVWIMPGCSNREQFEETASIAAKVCKEHGFKFSSRLQINLWNEVTGV